MDAAKLILTQQVSNPQKLKAHKDIDNLSEQQKKKIAREFEAVLMEKLMTQMKRTTASLAEEDSAADEQVKDIFWSQLGKGLCQQGGLGLWKDVYQFISETDNTDRGGAIDKSI